jgi:hypothetical protein
MAAPPPAHRILGVAGREETTIALGPVGLGGLALLVLGILVKRRLLAFVGLAGVVADVTVPELGGYKTFNEPRPSAPATPDAAP